MKRFGRILVAAFALAALGVDGAPSRAQDAPAGDAGNGMRVYLAVGCYMCHGRVGEGGAYNGVAPILAKTALPFEGFKSQLRNPANEMPAYSEPVMPEQEVADLYAFLQSLPRERPVKDFPILNN